MLKQVSLLTKTMEPFFYLCMEEHQMWAKTFGYQYSTNNDFEHAMLEAYCNRLRQTYLI